MADSKIQNAFLDGIEQIYSIMFTDRIHFSLLNEKATHVNVYEETINKEYHDPISLIGRVQTAFKQGTEPIETVQIDATFSIPTKQLITHQLPHTTESDLEILKRGKFEYDGYEYLVEKVVPKTLVADKWQMYDFICKLSKKSSLTDHPIIPNVVEANVEDDVLVVETYRGAVKPSIYDDELVINTNPALTTPEIRDEKLIID